jgi:hypothetical protein
VEALRGKAKCPLRNSYQQIVDHRVPSPTRTVGRSSVPMRLRWSLIDQHPMLANARSSRSGASRRHFHGRDKTSCDMSWGRGGPW